MRQTGLPRPCRSNAGQQRPRSAGCGPCNGSGSPYAQQRPRSWYRPARMRPLAQSRYLLDLLRSGFLFMCVSRHKSPEATERHVYEPRAVDSTLAHSAPQVWRRRGTRPRPPRGLPPAAQAANRCASRQKARPPRPSRGTRTPSRSAPNRLAVPPRIAARHAMPGSPAPTSDPVRHRSAPRQSHRRCRLALGRRAARLGPVRKVVAVDARDTCREARTQGAAICRHMGATEDAASRCGAPARRPTTFRTGP